MTDFVVYEPDSGRITRSGYASTPAGAALQAQAGEALVEGVCVSDAESYVLVIDGVASIAERPALLVCPVALPISTTPEPITPPLPPGTHVRVLGGPAAFSGAGEALHLPTEPGAWLYDITPPFPWRATRVAVTVTA